MPTSGNNLETAAAGAFRTTHWTLVLSAHPNSPTADQALAQLYQQYPYPVYVYIRRKGYSHHDAQDLTQELFAQLIGRGSLDTVSRDKGRFRTFLLACVDNCLGNHRQKLNAIKRGGEYAFISWDEDVAEERYRIEACEGMTPERAFDRRWALTVLANALAQLKTEYAHADKNGVFDRLQIFLSGEKHPASCEEVAAELSMTEAGLRVAVYRMRQRYGKLIRAEIARTVAEPEQIKEELHYLSSVLSEPSNQM